MRTLVVNALRLVGRRTAMGRYIEAMVRWWSRMEIPFDRVVLMSPVAVALDRLHLCGKAEIVLRSFGGRWPLSVWEQCLLPRVARGASGLFCPSYTCPLFYRGRIVLANHGIYERLPDEFPWWSRLRTIPLFRLSARRADHIIANSQNTKLDLVRYFHVPESRISVLYPAPNDLFFRSHTGGEIEEEVVRTLGRNVPYILFVGKLSKRRHVPNLIEAFSRVRRGGGFPHHLLIIGPNTTHIRLQELAGHHGVAEYVRYIPHMEQERLARLYAGADLFVLPTVYEGISWTILEAMASGTPVLTVEHPTLQEGAGEAVYAVPTPCVEDLVKGLTCLLTDQALRRSYAEKGRERAKQFSWEITARETMKILDRAANPSDR